VLKGDVIDAIGKGSTGCPAEAPKAARAPSSEATPRARNACA
jgi:hypothetical protein